MRDMEFRGWDIQHDCWVYGYYEDYMNAFGPHFATIHVKMDWNLNGSFKVMPDSIGQYTGLLDMNGKRVYDSDILRWKEWEQELTEVPDVYVMAWDNKLARFYMQCFRDNKEISSTDLDSRTWEADKNPLYDMEVVGNTWEKKKTSTEV